MSTDVFHHNPKIEELGKAFPESPYFSIKALAYRPEGKSGILAMTVQGSIAGALLWEDDGRLKIGQVEVHPDHRGNDIGPRLILEA